VLHTSFTGFLKCQCLDADSTKTWHRVVHIIDLNSQLHLDGRICLAVATTQLFAAAYGLGIAVEFSGLCHIVNSSPEYEDVPRGQRIESS
jgi:hypothetical protein